MPTNTPEQFNKNIIPLALPDSEKTARDERLERMNEVIRSNGGYVRDAPAQFPQHRANEQTRKDLPQ